MSHRPSPFPTPVLALLCLCMLAGLANGAPTPIKLADAERIPFPGSSLVVADMDGASGPDLVGVSGSDVAISLNNGQGGFGAPQTVAMGGGTANAPEVGDLDGDGRNDLVVLAPNATSITVRLNGPGLVFGPPQVVTLPGAPWFGFALGDLNGDDRPDVAVTSQQDQSVAILLNDGAGSLGAAIRLDVPGALSAPLIGDFNGDGHADVLLGTHRPGHCCIDQRLMLLAGAGDGSFAPPTAVSPPGNYVVHLASADLDADGDLDVVSHNETDLAVFENLGDGSFGPPQLLATNIGCWYDPVIGDVDRDGRPDIVLTCNGDWFGPLGFVVVHRNQEGLNFGPVMKHGIGPDPEDAAVADLDGDGWLEAIAACGGASSGICTQNESRSVYVLHNSGSGALDGMLEVIEPVWLPVRSGVAAVPDLVGSSPAGVMFRAQNLGNGTFDRAQAVGWGTPIAARDLDADGDEELLVTSGDSTWVLPNLGAAGFGAPGFTLVGFAFRDFADFDGDGHLDILATAPDSELVMFPGDGACGFGAGVHFGRGVPVASDADAVRGADLNNDGFADVLYVQTERTAVGGGGYDHTTKLFALLNDRAGELGAPDSSIASFQNPSPFSHHPGFLRLGDWNGDGLRDAAHVTDGCMNGSGASTQAFIGAGDGTFVAAGAAGLGAASWCDAGTADLNGDHLDDLVLLNSTSGCNHHALLRASDGVGEFRISSYYPMGVQPVSVHFADLDGDGRLDVVTLNDYRGILTTYSIRRNVTPGDLPTPALASLVSARVEDGVVHLDWFAADAGFSGSIERRTSTSGWTARAFRTSDGTGHLRYADHDVESGESYAYRLRIADSSGEHAIESGWLTVPALTFALRGAFPNPSSAQPTIAFTLPAAGDAEVHVLDVAGRVVHRERLPGLGSGPQRVTLGGGTLEPGYYVVRLGFAGRRLQRALVVVR